VACGLVTDEILSRKKQPYRAPDARAFLGPGGAYVSDLLSERAVREAGVFDVKAITALRKKCSTRDAEHTFSNADNMAFVGVLSTQLVHQQFVRSCPLARAEVPLRVDVSVP
jgi:asparagine synthase (glutamine-hydrolysing)